MKVEIQKKTKQVLCCINILLKTTKIRIIRGSNNSLLLPLVTTARRLWSKVHYMISIRFYVITCSERERENMKFVHYHEICFMRMFCMKSTFTLSNDP